MDGDELSVNISGDASNYLNVSNSELINISGIAPAITGQGYQDGIKEDLFTITVVDPSGASSNVDVEYLILENRTHFLDQKINGELIVGETVSPEFTPLDPQGIKLSPSVSWYSSLNSDGSYKSFLGSGLDGDWKLNSEQYGHYLGYQISLIDNENNFEQSEIYWSDTRVSGDGSQDTSAVFSVDFTGEFIVGNEIVANTSVFDPDGWLGYLSYSWVSIDDQTGEITVLGPGKDGSFFLNPEQYGERIGVQLSFIDSVGTFEQSERIWSDSVVTGDSSGSNDTVFQIEFIGDVRTGGEVSLQLEASDINGLSNAPLYSWKAGELRSDGSLAGYAIKIDGYYAKHNEPIVIPSEYFGQYLGVHISVIDDLGNYFADEFIYDSAIIGRTPSLAEISVIHIDEDETLSENLSLYLVDDDISYGDTHRYKIISEQTFATVNAETGLITFNPEDKHVGINEIIFKVTDSQGLSAEQTLQVSVSNTNDAPKLQISHQEKGFLGMSYSSLVQVDDDDKDSGDIIQVQIEGPDWLAYDPVSNLVKGTPPTTGSFEYTVIATDSTGASVSKTNKIDVSDKLIDIFNVNFVSLSPSSKPEGFVLEWPDDISSFETNEKLGFIKVDGFVAEEVSGLSFNFTLEPSSISQSLWPRGITTFNMPDETEAGEYTFFIPIPLNWSEDRNTNDLIDTTSNSFGIGREEYYDSSKNIHFDDFVYRSPLDPDTAILIPETRPPLMTGLIRQIIINISN